MGELSSPLAPGRSWLRALLIGSLTTLPHSGYGPSTLDPTNPFLSLWKKWMVGEKGLPSSVGKTFSNKSLDV